MKVEIWSDVACPFCYLGKKKFGQALEAFRGKEQIEIEWKSFMLNPDLVTDPSVRIEQYLSDIKGISPQQARQMNDRVAAAGAEAGIAYRFDAVVLANTLQAHRFLHFAKAHGKQNDAEELLFRAYFCEGKNVDDRETLLSVGDLLGLNHEQLRDALASGAYTENVSQDLYEARQIGVRGVPYFVFNDRYAVSGAKDASLFSEVLERAFSEWEQNK